MSPLDNEDVVSWSFYQFWEARAASYNSKEERHTAMQLAWDALSQCERHQVTKTLYRPCTGYPQMGDSLTPTGEACTTDPAEVE